MEHILAARADSTIRHDTTEREERKARAHWRIDTIRDLATPEELEEWAALGESIIGRRP